MLDRRRFLVQGVGAGAVLAAGGLVGTACVPPPEGPTTGFAVGQQLPAIVGQNGFGGTSSSTDYLGSWVLLDLCPWWCNPCRFSATHQAEFAHYVRSQGIDLRILGVVVEKSDTSPSTRFDAERWAGRFGLNSEIVLHCNGDAQSPLPDLFTELGAANGRTPGYPTYVIVDPAGVIRHYELGSDLNLIQAALEDLTGTTLTHSWPPTGGIVPPDLTVTSRVATFEVTGKYLDGAPFDDILSWDGPTTGVFVGTLGSGLSPLLSTFPGVLSSFGGSLDPDTAITLTCAAQTPPPGGEYSRVVGTDEHVAIFPDDAFSLVGETVVVDDSLAILATGTTTTTADGVTLTIPAITTLLAGEPLNGRTFSLIAIRPVAGSVHWATPYTLAQQLVTDAAASGLPVPEVDTLTDDLQSVLTHLAPRNYPAAAAAAHDAVDTARSHGAPFGLCADLQLLAQQLDDAVAGL